MSTAIKLHANKFEELIYRRGRIVKWRESVVCSCTSDGHPSYDCRACKGMGRTLMEPVEDVVLLTSIVHNQDFEAMAGVFELGDAVMTVGYNVPEVNKETGHLNRTVLGRPNLLFNVGYGDLITLTDDEYKTSEVLVKDTPMYGREADTLINEEVTGIVRIQKADQVTGDITVFEKGADYTFEGNRIIWYGNNEPMSGETYTVVYLHRPVFTVFANLPTPRYQDGQNLPKKVALRYLAGGIDRR